MSQINKNTLFLFFLFFLQFTSAQQFKFDVINHEKGLNSSRVNKIYKDSRGLLWICGDGAGLFSYNGNKFKNYNKVNNIENLFITDIIENQNKQLVLSSNYVGILFFEGNKFIKLTKLIDEENTPQTNISRFTKTKNGIYGFSTISIYFIDNTNKVTKRKDLKHLSISKITSVEAINNDLILIATNKGLYVYDIKNNTIDKVKNFNHQLTICKGIHSNVLLANELGEIYDITFKNKVSYKTKLIVHVKAKNNSTFNITNILQNTNGNIWFTGTKETGIGVLYRNKKYTILDKKNGLPFAEYLSISSDNGIINIGTDYLGFFQLGKQDFIKYNAIPELNTPYIFNVLDINKKLYTLVEKKGILKFANVDLYNFKYIKPYLLGIEFLKCIKMLMANF